MTGAVQPGAVRTLRMAVVRAVGSAARAGVASGGRASRARAKSGRDFGARMRVLLGMCGIRI